MFSVIKNEADLDLWHRMAVGKIFSQINNVLLHDIFTYFPAKASWIDHEWLSGVIFYNITQLFGDTGIIFFRAAIIFSVLILIHKTTQVVYPEPKKQRIMYYIMAIFAIIPGFGTVIRCQSFTYLFFTLWIYILERIRKNNENRLLWIFPATILLWLNLHAGFLAGMGLLVFYAVGEFFNKKPYKKYVFALLTCLPVTLLNPYGIKYWPYLIEATTMKRPHITEWEPFNPFENIMDFLGIKIILILALPVLFYTIIKKIKTNDKSIDWASSIMICTLFAMGCHHQRHLIFFGIAALIFWFKYFALFFDNVFLKIKNLFIKKIPFKKQKLVYFAGMVFCYCFLINCSLILIINSPINVVLKYYPTKAIEFIKINSIKGNLYVPFNWGSYALWKLYPYNYVSIDGRYEETYTNQAYKDSCDISFNNPKEWKEVFNRHRHDIVISPIEKNNTLYKNLKKLPNWKEIYKDEKAAVFVPDTNLKNIKYK